MKFKRDIKKNISGSKFLLIHFPAFPILETFFLEIADLVGNRPCINFFPFSRKYTSPKYDEVGSRLAAGPATCPFLSLFGVARQSHPLYVNYKQVAVSRLYTESSAESAPVGPAVRLCVYPCELYFSSQKTFVLMFNWTFEKG